MPCEGSPSSCDPYGEGDCAICGCDWELEFLFCYGSASPCSTFGYGDCQLCGCDWIVPGINVKINIGGAWKDASEMKINIGDSWKVVTKIQINIGDVWKTVYQA